MFLRDSAAMWRSTAISEACISSPWIGPCSRASSGTSLNSSSIEPAPITRSISLRSASERGRYLTGHRLSSSSRKRGPRLEEKLASRFRGNDERFSRWLPHDEAKANIIGNVGADAVGDGGCDLRALG